jgi:hypothetical protein
MTSNENLNSQNPRAQSEGWEAEKGTSTHVQSVPQPSSGPVHGSQPAPEINSGQGQDVEDKSVRVPTLKKPEELPIDCTIQMRGRTLNSQAQENQVPWEKSSQPEEPAEKILPLPVRPPPSATNNRLAAMKLPADSQQIQSQVEQAASSGFDVQGLDDIASKRQAVRYKPSAQSSTAPGLSQSKSEKTLHSEHTRSEHSPSEISQSPAQARKRQAQFYSDEEISPPARTRINPNLLKSARSADNHSRLLDDDDDDRRFKSSNSMPKFSWSEMSYLLKFYVREVKSLLINPHEFYLAHTDDTTLGEPIAFMVISAGIAAIFMSLAGDLGGGLSILFGTCAYTVITSLAVTYAMDFFNTSNAPKGDLGSTFKIIAYSAAPLLITWIKLGSIPAGWWGAFAYSTFLCIVGLEEVYGMNRQKSLVMILAISLLIHGLLHMMGL